MILRPHQERGIARIREAFARGRKAPLYVAPCGAGKTVLFSAIAKSAMERGKRVMTLVHRKELIDQVDRTYSAFDIPHGFVAADYGYFHMPIQIASVQTLVRRLDRVQEPDLIIIDEAHHATAGMWDQVIRQYSNAKLLGVTATPVRMGGEGLGGTFDELIIGPTAKELIGEGYLVQPRVFAPPTIDTRGMHTLMGEFVKSEVAAAVEKPKVTGDAITHYQRLAPGKRAVVFCHSLKHSHDLAVAARAAGITAVEMDGTMDLDVRRRILKDFTAGLINWLVTVDIVAEGFDAPGIECGIFLRPTQSLGLWIQMAGRCIRSAPSKTDAILLDHAGNTLRHGMPDADQVWSLEATKAKKPKEGESERPVAVCAHCFSAQPPAKVCAYCKKPFPIKYRKVAKADGELKEITAEELEKRRMNREIGMAAARGNREKLAEIARIMNYSPGWIEHRIRAAANIRKGRA